MRFLLHSLFVLISFSSTSQENIELLGAPHNGLQLIINSSNSVEVRNTNGVIISTPKELGVNLVEILQKDTGIQENDKALIIRILQIRQLEADQYRELMNLGKVFPQVIELVLTDADQKLLELHGKRKLKRLKRKRK